MFLQHAFGNFIMEKTLISCGAKQSFSSDEERMKNKKK